MAEHLLEEGEVTEVKTGGCFKCGEEGHMSRDCPNPGAGRARRGGCFKCGEEGHMSRDCPNPGSRGGGGGDEEPDNSLPIDEHTERILAHINKYRVTCIQGETGSGKSTRVPQFIVKQYDKDKTLGTELLTEPRIIVTQPRRIAAKSLGERVASELGEKNVGGRVGYKIGQNHRASENTQICFVTSGYLIELLVHNHEAFDSYTHIILDEIHERDLDADLLSLMVKLLMKSYTKPKLIIMSATLQAKLFLEYFCDDVVRYSATDERVLFVGVESPFNVTTIYLEDIAEFCQRKKTDLDIGTMNQLLKTYIKFTDTSVSELLAEDDDDATDKAAFKKMAIVARDIEEFNNQDKRYRNQFPEKKFPEKKFSEKKFPEKRFPEKKFPERRGKGDKQMTVKSIEKDTLFFALSIIKISAESKGNILIFLPGVREIDEFYDILLPYQDKVIRGRSCTLKVFPLHSKLQNEDQQECFQEPQEGTCHVVLATNIAESSITLPCVNVVIDFGQRRHVAYDCKKRMSTLQLDWCSQASMMQRKGRTGRVCDGVCFRIMTAHHFKEAKDYDEPQMKLSPLDKLVLQVKYMSAKIAPDIPPSELLSMAVEPPDHEMVYTAVKNLADVGALTAQDENSDVTLLGNFCMHMPLDLNLCRLVFFGVLFGCPCDAIAIAAALQSDDIFKQPTNKILKDQQQFIKKQKESVEARRKFDSELYSEPIMYRNVIKTWFDKVETLLAEKSGRVEGKGSEKGKVKGQKLHLKQSRSAFSEEHCMRPKGLQLLESTILDVSKALIRWLPSDSTNHTFVKALLNKIPRNRKEFTSYAEDSSYEKWESVTEAALNEKDLFSQDKFLLNMLLAAAFVPKYVVGKVGGFGKASVRTEKMKTMMGSDKIAVTPRNSVCIGKPRNVRNPMCNDNPLYFFRNNHDLSQYMSKCLSLNVEEEPPRSKKTARQQMLENRIIFNQSDQMFIQFNSDESTYSNIPTGEYEVTDNVHSAVVNSFHFTEGAHYGKDVFYELTREEDIRQCISSQKRVQIMAPDNPYKIDWELMSSNGEPLKRFLIPDIDNIQAATRHRNVSANVLEEQTCRASCNRNRNPVGFVCDTKGRDHYGIVSSLTANGAGNLCWVEGMSMLPIYKQNLFAVVVMLLFLPHQHGAQFKILTSKMIIAEVILFKYRIHISQKYQLTKSLLQLINKMRKETSLFFKCVTEETKEIPYSKLYTYFRRLMAKMQEAHINHVNDPEHKFKKESEIVNGFSMNYSLKSGTTCSDENYLKPYNVELLCDEDTLYNYCKQRDMHLVRKSVAHNVQSTRSKPSPGNMYKYISSMYDMNNQGYTNHPIDKRTANTQIHMVQESTLTYRPTPATSIRPSYNTPTHGQRMLPSYNTHTHVPRMLPSYNTHTHVPRMLPSYNTPTHAPRPTPTHAPVITRVLPGVTNDVTELENNRRQNGNSYIRVKLIVAVILFGYAIELSARNQLTKKIFKLINKMRKEASISFRDDPCEEKKAIPDSKMHNYFGRLMAEMDSTAGNIKPKADRYSKFRNEFEVVDGFHQEMLKNSDMNCKDGNQADYLEPYNIDLLFDKDILYTFCKKREKKKTRGSRGICRSSSSSDSD